MPARHLSRVLFPLPFRPTIPNISPFGDLERDILYRAKLVELVEAKRMKSPLFERVDLEVRDPEGLANAPNDDCRRLLAAPEVGAAELFA